MSSIQASALNIFLRVLRNRMFGGHGDHVALRQFVDNACKHMPKPPEDIDFRQENVHGMSSLWVKARGGEPDKVILYLHGGGYIFCSAQTTHKDMLWRLAQHSKCRILAIDYRLAPENPFPAAIDDAVIAYQWLLEQGIKPKHIAIAGDSAGGGLTFATVLKLKDMKLPLPALTVGFSPWTDLAITGESVITNLKRDALIPGESIREGAEWYLNGADPYHPYASPLYGKHKGMPPAYIQVSRDEVLLDDSRRLAQKYRDAGVKVDIEIWDNMPHVWQILAVAIPEGKVALKKAGEYIRATLHGGDKIL